MRDEEIQFELKSIIANDPFLRNRFKIGIWDSKQKKYRKPVEKDIERLQNMQNYTNKVLELRHKIRAAAKDKVSLKQQIADIEDSIDKMEAEMLDMEASEPLIFSGETEIF